MIDSHHHFWIYTDEEFGWISDDMAVLRSDFLPDNLAVVAEETNSIEGVISVQARCTHEENDFLLAQAESSDLVIGVSGWVDLRSQSAGDSLDQYASHPKFKGVREICQGAANETFLANTDFDRGIREVTKRDLAYDLLIFQDQLVSATAFAARHPDQRMVVDHCAKPEITADGVPNAWKKGITGLAALPHVSCKFSGLTTEIRDQSEPCVDLFRPYFDILLECFGPDRLMFGSDWPVSLLGTSYQDWVGIFETLISELSDNEQRKIGTENALTFYK